MDFQRVTEILYPFSGLKHVDPQVLENAAVRGTKVHKACEAIVEGLGEWNIEPEHRGYIESFKSWWGKGRKVLSVEERFYCERLGVTGQVDLIVEEPDGVYIVDLKTSASESKSWLLQGSAYSYMAKKKGYPIEKIMFLKLLRDGRVPKQFYYEENMQLFEECLNVYRYFYGRKQGGRGK